MAFGDDDLHLYVVAPFEEELLKYNVNDNDGSAPTLVSTTPLNVMSPITAVFGKFGYLYVLGEVSMDISR